MKPFTYFYGAIIIIASGCTHYYYAPGSANIPLFKEKHETRVNAGYSFGDQFQGADIQLAYSPTPKTGVMLNGFVAGKTETDGSNDYPYASGSGHGSYFEGGAGYYKPFGAKKAWIFETYGGAGLGKEKHTYGDLKSEISRLTISKIFIQPSIGYSSQSGLIEVAVGSRLSTLNLRVTDNTVSGDSTEAQQLDYIGQHPFSLLWEPSLMISGGFKSAKLCLRMTPSYNLNNPYLEQENINFNIGLRLTLK